MNKAPGGQVSMWHKTVEPPRPSTIPTWDLTLVLKALTCSPFEPLQSASLKVLSFKMVLLLSLLSVKRFQCMINIHALSVNDLCMDFGLDDCKVILRPREGYIPKVLSTPFRSQVIMISVFAPSKSELQGTLPFHSCFALFMLCVFILSH